MDFTALLDKEYLIRTYNLSKKIKDKELKKFYLDNAKTVNPSATFNTSFFITRYSFEKNDTKLSPLEYFWENCETENLDPNPLFDTKTYLQQNPDVKKADINPFLHYLLHGYYEGRSPHFLFDKDYIASQMKAEGSYCEADNLYVEFLAGRLPESISSSPFFDNNYYLKRNEVKIEKEFIPVIHYITEGEKIGFSPNPFVGSLSFNKGKYGSRLEKLLEDNEMSFAETSTWFEPAWYKKKYLPNYDFINPLKHYLLYGLKEGKQPKPTLFPEVYMKVNNKINSTDLAKASNLIFSIENENISSKYEVSKPLVSIVILNWNKSITTAQCISCIHEYTSDVLFEIVIVDNGSTHSQFIELQKYCGKKAKIIRLSSNKFFGEANNIGVEEAAGEFVMLLNNDAFVTPNWLKPLLKEFEEDDEMGLVGPKFLFPDGKLQEAGGIMSACGQGIQIGKFLNPDSPAFQIKREVDYCSAAAVLCRRTDYLQVLGFDLIYEPAYYEDGDFCMKIKKLGKKILYQPQSSVYHIENHTSKDENIGFSFNSLVAINKLKFVNRWSEFIASGHPVDKESAIELKVFEREKTKKPIAVLYSPYNVMPGGGEKYLLTLGETLTESYDVYFSTPEKISQLRLLTVGRELNINVRDIMPIAYDQALKLEIALFVVMGNEIFPSVPAVGKKNIYHCQFPFAIQPGQENNIKYFGDYDKLIVNSEFTRSHIYEQMKFFDLPPTPVEILYPPIDQIDYNPPRSTENSIHIINVGRFFTGGHQKRQDVIIEAFKEFVKKNPTKNAKLTLAGAVSSEQNHISYLEDLRRLASGYDIDFLINPTNNQITEIYKSANIYIHATGFGSDERESPEIFEHFGITVVEAALHNNYIFAYDGGGPKEIINDFPGVGQTYQTVEELVMLLEKTTGSKSFDHNPQLHEKMLQKFGANNFRIDVNKLV